MSCCSQLRNPHEFAGANVNVFSYALRDKRSHRQSARPSVRWPPYLQLQRKTAT